MKQHQLIIAPVVREQIRDQVMFIARHSVVNALAWEDRLERAIRDLTSITGYAIDEDASDRLGYLLHRLTFEGTYLIHYTIDADNRIVRVVNFRHGARLPRPGEP